MEVRLRELWIVWTHALMECLPDLAPIFDEWLYVAAVPKIVPRDGGNEEVMELRREYLSAAVQWVGQRVKLDVFG